MANSRKPKVAELGVLKPTMEKFLAANILWLGLLLWAISRLIIFSYLGSQGEIPFFHQTASRLLSGTLPWAEGGGLAHLPLGLLLSSIPALLSDGLQAYTNWFTALVLICDLATIYILYRIGLRAKDGDFKGGLYLSGLYLIVSSLAFESLINSLSLPIILVMTLILRTILSDSPRRSFHLGVITSLAVNLHVVFVLILPLLLLDAWNQESKKTEKSFDFLKGFATAWLIVFPIFLFLTGPAVLTTFVKQIPQGLHLESLYTSIIMIFDRIMGHEGEIREFFGPLYLSTATARQLVLPLALAALAVWIGLNLHIHKLIQQRQETANRFIIPAASLIILATGIVSPWWSQNILLWALPLILYDSLGRSQENKRLLYLLSSSFALTSLFKQFYFEELLRIDYWPAFMMIVRNLIILYLIVIIAAEIFPSLKKHLDQSNGYLDQISARASSLVLPCIILWTIAASYTGVTSNDYWYHARIGQDIWQSMQLIYHDTYSAILNGKEFIAHEWLTGVIFYLLGNSQEGIFLTVLRIIIALMVTALVYMTIPKQSRRHLIFYPLLFLALYQVNMRIHVRPHLFSLLFVSALIYALESFRKHKNIRKIWWLVPMQILWVNMHGSYLFSLAFLGIYLSSIMALMIFPKISPDDSSQFSVKHVKDLGLLLTAMFIACLVNPYGYHIFGFSLSLFSGHDYFKQYIFEWLSPFKSGGDNYWYVTWLFYMTLIWGALLLNYKKRPFLDAVVLVVLTYLTVSANRYISLGTIISFPVLMRQMSSAMERWLQPNSLRMRPVLNLVLIGFFLGSTLNYGYPYNRNEHKTLMAGLDLSKVPMDAISFLKDNAIEGNIYNHYTDGAYIIHYLYPKIRPVMDSRVDLYGKDLYLEYTQSFQSNRRFVEYLKKYQVNIVMLWKIKSLQWAFEILDKDPNWQVAFVGKSHVVLLRKN